MSNRVIGNILLFLGFMFLPGAARADWPLVAPNQLNLSPSNVRTPTIPGQGVPLNNPQPMNTPESYVPLGGKVLRITQSLSGGFACQNGKLEAVQGAHGFLIKIEGEKQLIVQSPDEQAMSRTLEMLLAAQSSGLDAAFTGFSTSCSNVFRADMVEIQAASGQ